MNNATISKTKTLGTLVACFLIIISVLGCGFIDRMGHSDQGAGSANTNLTGSANTNKTFTDTAVDTAVGESKIGVPECDEVMDMLTTEANNPEDGFVTKAVKATFLNKIKDAIKQEVEQNKSDPAELAKTCKEFKAQLQKFKAQQEAAK